MSWYNDKGDFWNLLGDPGGYVTGVNKEGFGGIKKAFAGDPDAIKKAYDEAMGMSRKMGEESKDFLMDREKNALAFYSPIQSMFQNAYGSQGLMAPQTPQAPGGPIQGMYGVRMK